MGILRKIAAQAKRKASRLRSRSQAVARDVASMQDDRSYTLRTKSGKSLTLTGEQWKQLEQQRLTSGSIVEIKEVH